MLHTEEFKKRLSKTRQGKGNPFYGRKHSEKSRQQMSKARKGRKLKPAHRRAISKALMGHEVSQRTRKKMSEALKGHSGGFKGKTHTEESRRKMSEALKGRRSPNKGKFGKEHPSWRGGESFKDYGPEWTKELRREVMERDGEYCRNPGCRKISDRLTVHHINYIRKDNRLENLITICPSCNSRANSKRHLWPQFYGILSEELNR